MRSICRSRNSALRFVDQLCNEIGEEWNKPYLISAKVFKPPRSLEQNAKLHCLFRDLSAHTGYTESEIKDVIKARFGLHKVVQIDGTPTSIAKSTTEYSREELSDLMDRVYMLGAEIGCVFLDED